MSDSNDLLNLLLLSPDPDLCTWLFTDLGVDPTNDLPQTAFAGKDLVFNSYTDPSSRYVERPVDILVGLVRFVDVLSLQKMDQLLKSVPGYAAKPVAMLVYRNDNEQDFKMSCPYCGQKLWVRDADLDKRGRCPHCKKGFTLPGQEAHVKSALHLGDTVPVRRVTRGDAGSLAAPLRSIVSLKKSSILDHLEVKSEVANRQTMNVDIDLEDD